MTKSIIIAVLVLILVSSVIPKHIKNYKDFSEWISEFTYQNEDEGKDYWKTPEETINDKGGDCEDFAILAIETLRKLGYKIYLIVVSLENSEGKLAGHAIALLKHHSNGFSFFSNNSYYPTKHKDLPTLLDNNYPTWLNAKLCNETKKCFFEVKSKRSENMKYVVVRRMQNGLNPLVIDSDGNAVVCNNRESAELERIYHQPDYDELLSVFETMIGENK